MDIDEALYRLRLYNEKVEKLRRSRFFQRVMADRGIRAMTSARMDQPLTISLDAPDEDNIDAFVTTYRFFIQPRDKIDRPHMKELYQALRDAFGFAEGEYKHTIEQAIRALDSADAYFAADTSHNIDGQAVSRGTLHDVMIYGGTAHANRDKKVVYDYWAASVAFPLITLDFMAILLDALRSIVSFYGLNEHAIQFLERKKSGDR